MTRFTNLVKGIRNLVKGIDNLDVEVHNLMKGIANLTKGITNLDDEIVNLMKGITNLDVEVPNLVKGIRNVVKGIGNLDDEEVSTLRSEAVSGRFETPWRIAMRRRRNRVITPTLPSIRSTKRRAVNGPEEESNKASPIRPKRRPDPDPTESDREKQSDVLAVAATCVVATGVKSL